MSKRGLPTGLSMRHDAHYVEELASQRSTPIGRLISLENLDPNPEQPRVEIGDLTDLTSSIKEKGVLEPLLVKPSKVTGRWMIIAGERRWRASKAAGLKEVPCIEMDVDDRAVAEIALVENMQRKDLTAWEEADGLAALCEKFGYTHEDVARKVGKSRTTVTEGLSIANLPEKIREECRRADISAKSTLLQIVRQPDETSMYQLVAEVAAKSLNRDAVRAASKARQGGDGTKKKPQSPQFTYLHPGGAFKAEIKFSKINPKKSDIIDALKTTLAHLENPFGSDND